MRRRRTELPPAVAARMQVFRKCIAEARWADAARELGELYGEAVERCSGAITEHDLDGDHPGMVDDKLVQQSAAERRDSLHAAQAATIEMEWAMRSIEAAPKMAEALDRMLAIQYSDALAAFRSMYIRNLWETSTRQTVRSMAKRANMDPGWLSELLAGEGLRPIARREGGRG